MESIDKAISISPDKLAYHAYKAKFCYEMGRYEDIQQELQKIDFEKLGESVHNKHIKDIILEIQNKQQEPINIIITNDNKDDVNNLNKSSISIEQQKLQSRIENLEAEVK